MQWIAWFPCPTGRLVHNCFGRSSLLHGSNNLSDNHPLHPHTWLTYAWLRKKKGGKGCQWLHLMVIKKNATSPRRLLCLWKLALSEMSFLFFTGSNFFRCWNKQLCESDGVMFNLYPGGGVRKPKKPEKENQNEPKYSELTAYIFWRHSTGTCAYPNTWWAEAFR